MEIESLMGLAGAGVVMALVAASRQAVAIPDRFTPLLAIAMGVAWNAALKLSAADYEIEWGATVIMGVLSGLAASGLWTGGKSVAREIRPPGGVAGPPPGG